MPQRTEAIRHWLTHELGYRNYSLTPASTDASFRRYFRVAYSGGSAIVMDAPPEKEDSRPYVDIARRLSKAGVTVPEVLAMDLDKGFLLITDLGTTLYLDRLNEGNRDPLYRDAIAAMQSMQLRADTRDLPDYDKNLLTVELSLFSDWFLSRHLDIQPNPREGATLASQFDLLVESALSQPQVFVHRDYHSRNLMILAEHNPGILDFQGAVKGPVTYDLVSLLRDCYIEWPAEYVRRWMAEFYEHLTDEVSLTTVSLGTFERWFDWMGLQRHLKAIGIFARLHHRDGKPGYLQDIPRTLDYVMDVAGRYDELRPLHRLLAHWNVKERHMATLPPTQASGNS